MIKGLFGSESLSSALRAGLEESAATHREIAARIAAASTSSSETAFAGDLEAAARRAAEQADLQRDMAALADNELRFSADARLLQHAYGRLRTAIRGDRA